MTHAVSHLLSGDEQVKPQVPPAHVALPPAGALHACPHLLQFAVLVDRSTQELPHTARFAGHPTTHFPAEQT